MLTAWDGYARLDWLPAFGRLQVTLLTAEPTVFRRLHSGLACAFVEDDRTGPPAFVELTLATGITGDVPVLLGDRLAALASSFVRDGGGSGSVRLDLLELEEIAETWAPYRDRVLAPEPDPPAVSAGSWARDLWTWIGGGELREAVGALASAGEGFRDGGEVAWHAFTIPEAMAATAGVDAELAWAVYEQLGERGIVVRAHAVGEVSLLAGLDDGSGTWAPFEPDGEEGVLLAELPLGDLSSEPALRFRTDTEER
ncbi:hypothetical protein GCM10027598_60890 [Amycolatopsis oliviviridis]|uniref:Uncharacterized protein n=1 Tax=Amycolatopsis oliviviridis TaxID=1471590 RepID=A0ABQ3M3J6_9PSEU|nr:hypothetical protein [Amycolatopsis oliviviridis]GHH32294.1 hypothetical protein GCM10017790_69190 [Amycolatopsis oliviviridis]